MTEDTQQAIEQERAKKRQDEMGRNHGDNPSGNVSERGEARDKAAEKVNAARNDYPMEKTTNPMQHPDRVTEDTQQAIAEDLGVSRKTVGRATDELPEDVKRGQLTELNTDEKRERVREYVEDTPDTPGPADGFTASTRSRAPSGDSPRIHPDISAGPYNRPRAVKQSKIQAGHNSPRTRRGVATSWKRFHKVGRVRSQYPSNPKGRCNTLRIDFYGLLITGHSSPRT